MKPDLYPELQKFINQQNEAYEKITGDAECENFKKYEDTLFNYELELATAILNQFSREPLSSQHPAVKVAKIILAATGYDNRICISNEFK